MEQLENISGEYPLNIQKIYPLKKKETGYSIFAEQYLEKMQNYSGMRNNITVTCCTFKGIPTIDDF